MSLGEWEHNNNQVEISYCEGSIRYRSNSEVDYNVKMLAFRCTCESDMILAHIISEKLNYRINTYIVCLPLANLNLSNSLDYDK